MVASDRNSSRRGTLLAMSLPFVAAALATVVSWPVAARAAAEGPSVAAAIERVQPKIVKIYGAGGFRRLEAYQTGMLISPEGHILTVFSYVLDTDYITATLADGRKFEAKLLGADPRLDVAVLKIEATGLPYFDLAQAVEVDGGARVLALSNLFGVATGDEAASVQHGVISVKTEMAARQGTFETPYRGPVYVLDKVTNNPGAAGGALVTRQGALVAMLGKELRNARNNTWLNFALPIGRLQSSIDAIRAGKFVPAGEDPASPKPPRALDLARLGIALVPDVLERTPPYVDQVRPGTPAAAAGLRPDDLILLLGERLIQSCKSLRGELEYIDYEDPVKLTVLRGGELLEFVLKATGESERKTP